MMFSTAWSEQNEYRLNIKVLPPSTDIIEQVLDYKYLGVWLDSHLTFEKHVNSVISKVRSRTAILWHMRKWTSSPWFISKFDISSLHLWRYHLQWVFKSFETFLTDATKCQPQGHYECWSIIFNEFITFALQRWLVRCRDEKELL